VYCLRASSWFIDRDMLAQWHDDWGSGEGLIVSMALTCWLPFQPPHTAAMTSETPMPDPHLPRLTRELADLLRGQRVAALGTIADDGAPFVSMVPFAIEPVSSRVVLHVSGLAAHTGYLTARPRVSLLVMRPEAVGEPVHALPRLTLVGAAEVLARDSAEAAACRQVYLTRFPEAEPMTALGDFRFVAVQVDAARQIAGFGAARSVSAEELRQVLRAA